MRYVILGAGAAGIAAAEAIRSADPTGQIIMLADEAEGYYSRPGLAYYLTGEIGEEQLFPFSEKDFKQRNIELWRARATKLHPDAHEVELHDGSRLSYHRLLIAVGATASHVRLPGADAEGVVKLDTIADVRQMIKLSRRAKTAVVVGGGITALEMVEGLLLRGVKVHYFLRGSRYWSNVLEEEESRLVEQRLADEGVAIHYNSELGEILVKNGKVEGVRTKDGGTIQCQMVGVAIGVQPRKELAEDAGIECDRGILVDDQLQTSAADVYAAGDVAQVFDPAAQKHILDSLWSPARQQGNAAGLNMAGRPVYYRKLTPFNVTRLAHLTTTFIGQIGQAGVIDADLPGIARGDSEVWRQMPDAIAAQTGFDVNRLRVLVGERTLVGAVVMGDQTLSIPLQKMIVDAVDITPIRADLLRPDAPVAEILASYWAKLQCPDR
jgi:NAD(P)H-nitrite reductase large subunit